jgi:lipoprotein-anchoring transpeptidase ErfK/SrfK
MENENLIGGTHPEKSDGEVLKPDSVILSQEKAGKQEEKSTGTFFKFFRGIFIFILSIIIILALFLFTVYAVPSIAEISHHGRSDSSETGELKKDPLYKKQVGLVTKDIQKLSTKYNSYTSGQSYIVVNTTDNRFSLFTNKNLIREGSCSTGSYIMLQASTGNKKWIFKTPRGKYWIHGKKTNPVWKRPDWSFVEEGAKIPSANDDSRYEYGVLGDYALTLGDGYMIHGTIYKRFLGMPVTHGCVRLNDDDLKVVYNTLNIGSKVYIF